MYYVMFIVIMHVYVDCGFWIPDPGWDFLISDVLFIVSFRHAQLLAVQSVQGLAVHHVHLRQSTVRQHSLHVALPLVPCNGHRVNWGRHFVRLCQWCSWTLAKSSHVFSCHFLNRMYDFTFTIVDGVPKIDRRDDLSDNLNDQAEFMSRAITPEYIV